MKKNIVLKRLVYVFLENKRSNRTIYELEEKIAQIEGKLKFFRSAILALVSGLVWVVYNLMEKKAGQEILVLGGVGTVILISTFFRTKILELQQNDFIDNLEKED